MNSLIRLVLCMPILTGCSSLTATMNSDPFRIDYISPEGQTVFGSEQDKTLGIISLDATRRVVLVSLTGDTPGRFCAEPPPDVGTALSIKSKLDATAQTPGQPASAPKLTANMNESFDRTITKLANRTVLLDIYRTGLHSLCQFHLNGAFNGNNQQLVSEFSTFNKAILDAYHRSEASTSSIPDKTPTPPVDKE